MTELETLPSGLKETLIEESGLQVQIYYLECLAQATYLLSHEGAAFIVDPRRDVGAFLQVLNEKGLTLKGILETHFHADFVSGHLEMNKKTGAPIYFGPTSGNRSKYPIHEVTDNEVIDFSSRYAIKVLHTPGHTPESVVYLVVDKDRDNQPIKAMTGDTLFIGSCGRPDLVGSVGFTSEQMARMMFHTLRDKISSLPDDVQVFPAHGAGSPCGKNLGSALFSTIGDQKKTNPALQYTNEDEFVEYLTEGLPTAPGYFSHDVQQNVAGADILSDELAKIPRVSAQEFHTKMLSGECYVVDTRPVTGYNAGHIKGSLNFPLGESGGAIVRVEDGNFAMWVGTLISSKAVILLVTDPGKDSEALQRLARIGYTNVAAVLADGLKSWSSIGQPLLTNRRIDIRESGKLESLLEEGYLLLDVRTKTEHQSNTAVGSTNVPLAEITTAKDDLDKSKKYIAFCSTGYRSVIASSFLRSYGFDAVDIYGGFAAVSVSAPQLTTTGKICPSMKEMLQKMASS